MFLLAGCGPPLPPSKPLSELTPQEAAGHQVYAAHCARCHYANTDRSLHGPGLQALYKQKYLPSGAPANDDRVTAVILHGHNLMPAFSGAAGTSSSSMTCSPTCTRYSLEQYD